MNQKATKHSCKNGEIRILQTQSNETPEDPQQDLRQNLMAGEAFLPKKLKLQPRYKNYTNSESTKMTQ